MAPIACGPNPYSPPKPVIYRKHHRGRLATESTTSRSINRLEEKSLTKFRLKLLSLAWRIKFDSVLLRRF